MLVIQFAHQIIDHVRERPLIPTDLKIRTLFGYGWVGGSPQNGCSDLEIRWLKKVKTNGFFYCGCSDLWVGEWVTINPNIVQIFKSVGIMDVP